MIALDTGITAPESRATLDAQQKQLIAGRRIVQMFPRGTDELLLPRGMGRCENDRGVFHFRPSRIKPADILRLSAQGRENEFLNLGQFSKFDIADRVQRHAEKIVFITEYVPGPTELRSACGTDKTIKAQKAYFERTKERNGWIVVGNPPPRVVQQWEAMNARASTV